MKINGIALESRGKERVIVWDNSEIIRTVYCVPNEWKFFIKHGGDLIEVYHKSCYFSVFKGVLDELSESQPTLLDSTRAWSEAIEKRGYIN